MNRGEFLQLKCSIPSGSKVYYFQESSVKLVYLEDLSTGIGIIPEATAITGLTDRVQELTDVSYTYKWNEELYRTFSNMGGKQIL